MTSSVLVISVNEQDWMNQAAQDVNEEIEQAASDNGVIYYDPNDVYDVYDDHRLGDQDSYIYGLNPACPKDTNQVLPINMGSFHPMETGSAAEAQDMYDMLGDR